MPAHPVPQTGQGVPRPAPAFDVTASTVDSARRSVAHPSRWVLPVSILAGSLGAFELVATLQAVQSETVAGGDPVTGFLVQSCGAPALVAFQVLAVCGSLLTCLTASQGNLPQAGQASHPKA